ncbi:NDMA-dependent alcohol dehydrogenase [Acidimicrobiia bacterium EGI L10123]|uniref:NDMA-dependent alcohol dehydrogenase n=1 Tax=Salinilacustrithrix flava TaxID=2957203 RepID=UPI003D7C2D60|nr:NDMA-dependent alcohol dehydrogenase [Acidimicrobiia bacterium EGI L10123]
METKAAILWEQGAEWSVEPIELDPPKGREVQVRLVASGMCHSDEHVVTGDLPGSLPIICGHEGGGVVEAVGPDVTFVEPGDHVVFSFVPSCGSCPSCASGHSNLCDNGGAIMGGRQMDGSSRHHARGQDLNTLVLLGTFAHHTVVHEWSCVKVPKEVPLNRACLVGCGFTTGWGSSVYAAEVQAGDKVAVVGLGGIGSAAVQGAALAGAEQIFAIDPVEWKREKAQGFGATHIAASLEEAHELIQEATWGRGCDKVIMAMGVGDGALMGQVMGLAAKRGRVVITNIHSATETSNNISLLDLTLSEKQVVGSLFGSANPRKDIPRLLELYSAGRIDLDGMVTRTYSLDDINQGFQDMREGKNIRGVLVYE